jgi:hypothetical protein
MEGRAQELEAQRLKQIVDTAKILDTHLDTSLIPRNYVQCAVRQEIADSLTYFV